MFNPNNRRHIERFLEAKDYSRRALEPFRENAIDMIRQTLGEHYGGENKSVEAPVNYYELAITTYTHQLVGGAPRAYTATKNQDLVWAAADLKATLDYAAERMDLESTLWRLVNDSLYCMGVAKVGTTDPRADGWWTGTAQPYIDRVALDDWVMDMTAKVWPQIGYCGNRYRMPLWMARENPDFDARGRRALAPYDRDASEGDADERAEDLADAHKTNHDRYEDEVEIWDYWFPREGLLVTMPDQGPDIQPLRVIQSKGPPTGPFRIFGFGDVSSNLVPLAPAPIWKDLHLLANEIFSKIGRQALRQKKVLPIRGAAPEEVQTFLDTPDGHAFRHDGEIPQEIDFGGPSQTNLLLFLQLHQIINRHMGNIDTLAGLASSADTLGQQELQDQNAGGRINWMRRRLNKFVDGCFTDLSWYLYEDPTVSFSLNRKIRGMDAEIPFEFSADTRQGKPSLFQVAIEPYSLVRRDPRSQFELVLQILRELVVPIAPEIMAANLDQILHMAAEKLDLPELDQLFFPPPPPPQQQRGGSGGSPRTMPPETTRNYVRRSAGGGGQEQQAMLQALSALPQDAAALARSAG